MDNKFLKNLAAEAENNPTIALGVAAAFLTACAKLVKAHGESAGSRAYARQVNYKLNHPKK